jgi:hypothetical protein
LREKFYIFECCLKNNAFTAEAQRKDAKFRRGFFQRLSSKSFAVKALWLSTVFS